MASHSENTTVCEKCGKKYMWQVQDWGCPGGKEREYAYCPYCNTAGPSAVTNGVINTRKIENPSDKKE